MDQGPVRSPDKDDQIWLWVLAGLFFLRVLAQALVAFFALRLQRRRVDNPVRPSQTRRMEIQERPGRRPSPSDSGDGAHGPKMPHDLI